MITSRRTTTDGLQRPVESGVFVDAYRVVRVITTRAELYTTVEAQGFGGERVTLTILAPPLVRDKEARRRVLALARLRASIEHPNLVEFHGAVESRNRFYLVSAPHSPRTLADLLGENRPDPGGALRLLGQVAGALETVAASGLTHRDLTPQAIVLGKGEPHKARALLTDFGIALPPMPACDLVDLGVGAAYRSPEEVRGRVPEPQSNVYSLACILVECLSGAPPYPYDPPLLTVHAHIVEPPPRVSERAPDLPPALDRVVARAMDRDPSKRFASPAEFIREAARTLGVEGAVPVIEAPVDEGTRLRWRPPRPARPWRLRRTTAWIGVALCASAVTGFAAGGVDWSGDTRPVPSVRSAPTQERPQNAAYSQGVTKAVESLRERRVAARRRLRAARGAAGQAAAAEALADAYERARRALPEPLPGAAGVAGLAQSLRDAERAYRKLAAAARGRDARRWRVARRVTLRREAVLQRALRTGQFS
jgi:Protein kinase domain